MARKFIPFTIAAAAAFLTPALAFAHTGVGQASGFMHGFMHPVGGLDHILAMVMVGVFAWQLGGKALWAVPASFVALMAVGGALGISAIPVPFVETGIALSVVILGGLVAFGLRASLAAAAGIVGLFAIFHGYAHGAEMPADASGLGYALGFMLATALLHIAGLGSGALIGRLSEIKGPIVVRSAGGVAALAGVGLLSGVL
ncbi:MAG: urease accessory protein [Rhizobium sp. 63-7]|mgnify:FL=1|nr:MAG: urease accessory protein [Rhizobium sp. 63-7]